MAHCHFTGILCSIWGGGVYYRPFDLRNVNITSKIMTIATILNVYSGVRCIPSLLTFKCMNNYRNNCSLGRAIWQYIENEAKPSGLDVKGLLMLY